MGIRRNVRPCIGGPHDGREATAAPKHLAYIDGDGRCWAKPGRGRALYEFLGERWIFAGFGAYICSCGSHVRQRKDGGRLPSCPLCGKGLRPRRRVP